MNFEPIVSSVSDLQTQVHSLSTQCESESENVVCLQNKARKDGCLVLSVVTVLTCSLTNLWRALVLCLEHPVVTLKSC